MLISKFILYLVTVTWGVVCAAPNYPEECHGIPVRLLQKHLRYRSSATTTPLQVGRSCRQKYYYDTALSCPSSEETPFVNISEHDETYRFYPEAEFMVEVRDYIFNSVTNRGEYYPLVLHTNWVNYEEESFIGSSSDSPHYFHIYDRDLKWEHFYALLKNKIELSWDDGLVHTCRKINFETYQHENAPDFCAQKISPVDFSALNKRQAIKNSFKRKKMGLADRIESWHDAVGFAWSANYRDENGVKIETFPKTHYAQNSFFLYKLMTRPPCPEWTIDHLHLNYHNGFGAYAKFSLPNGRQFKTQRILTAHLSFYIDSIQQMYTSDSRLAFHSCWSLNEPSNGPSCDEDSKKSIGNFFYTYTPAKIKGYPGTSYPLRPVANPLINFGRAKRLQNSTLRK